jgi:hypothetical protein
MDIHQLRGWAEFMDKGMFISLLVAAIAVAALGTTTWFSIKYNSAVRAQENAAFDQYKVEAADHAAKLEKEVALARERNAQLEKTVAEADERAAQAKKRALEVENSVKDANARAAELEKEATGAKARAEDAQLALERSKAPPAIPERQKSQLIQSLAKFVGTKAAIYTVDGAPDAAEVGSSINALLIEAGWASSTWAWAGVGGIMGLVVLTKEGNDPATDEAAAGIVDAFRSAGFNAAKADWPADWRKFRGTLNGPQTPTPTEAPIRIVIGAKSH